ncbi:oxidoreductase [Fontisphaera persica]|uniref:NADH-quinone oxidoreductase subunit B family protein n=1 Tax=Fontisphaera persica TaxID=2974023 RepID=UPI0024C01540|nr:oxidoreductase [Fontisphaera persica]WCJ60249.1 oxidoreductase [Fontisphaera persica]
MAKPKVAFYWCASCGGCEETVVDLAEDILGLVEKVEIVLWPVAMDFKYRDVEALPEGGIVATFLNGAIRSTEQAELARLLRRKSRYLIAYGSCAHMGGVPGLANLYRREELLRFNYEGSPSVVNEGRCGRGWSMRRGHRLHLPELHGGAGVGSGGGGGLLCAGVSADAVGDEGGGGGVVGGAVAGAGVGVGAGRGVVQRVSAAGEQAGGPGVGRAGAAASAGVGWDEVFFGAGGGVYGAGDAGGVWGQCMGEHAVHGCFGPTSRVRDQGRRCCRVCVQIWGRRTRRGWMRCWGMPDPVGTLYRYGLAKSLLRRKVGV